MATLTPTTYTYGAVVNAGTVYLFSGELVSPTRPRASRTLFYTNASGAALKIYWVFKTATGYDDTDLPVAGISQHASSTTISTGSASTIPVPEGAVGFYATTTGTPADVDLAVT